MRSHGKLFVVGIGPGCPELLTLKALKVLKSSDFVIGHRTYLKFVKEIIEGEIIQSEMGKELERVQIAINLVRDGNRVCLISGGDPSIYGIASLVAEYIYKNRIEIDWEVIPGISALNASSPLFGSAISGDHAVISLSDLLTSWDVIEKRLRKALEGDFVIAIYNPSSRKRKKNLIKALEIIRSYRGDIFIGIAKNVCRKNQEVKIAKISEVEDVDMHTILIIPNSESIVDECIITPRGYSSKYNLEGK